MLLHRRCRICSRPVCLNLLKHLSCLDRFFLTRVQYVAMGLYMFIYYYLFIYFKSHPVYLCIAVPYVFLFLLGVSVVMDAAVLYSGV